MMRLPLLFLLFASLCCYSLADKDTDALLFSGVRQDDEARIEKALKNGANINAIGSGGQTPLMHAVLQGKPKAVKMLLKKGADMTIGEKDGFTPMHGAGFQGRAEIAQMLINHGLDPSDMHEGDGHTPIHRACWGGEQRHTDTVKVFLKAGVSPEEESKKGERPIEMSQHNAATQKLLKQWIQHHKFAAVPGADANAGEDEL